MQTAIRWALCIIGIEILFLVAFRAGLLAIVPPLAASCILLAANPQGMFARPGTVLTAYIVVGHLGLINSVFWGNDLFCLFVMTLLVVGIMAAVPCIHPPAVALLFHLANSPHPFQSYLVTLCLMVGLLALHLAGQWFITQLFRTAPAIPRPQVATNFFETVR